MRQRVTSQSADPGAAAREALETAAFTSEPVDLVFNGDVDGIPCRDLTVEVRPGTPPHAIVATMRQEVRNQRR